MISSDKYYDIITSLFVLLTTIAYGLRTGYNKRQTGGIGEGENAIESPDKIVSLCGTLFASNNKITQAVLKKIITVLDEFTSYLTKDVLDDKPWADLTPEFDKKIVLLASYLEHLSHNKEQLESIRKLSEALGDAGVDIIQVSKPAVKRIIDESLTATQEIGEQSAEGMARTLTAVLQSFIAEIPGLGGLIDLAIAFGIGFNNASKVAIETKKSYDEIRESALEAKKEITSVIDKHKQNLSSQVTQFKDAITPTITTGGERRYKKRKSLHKHKTKPKPKHKTKKKLRKTINKINKSLKMFLGGY